MVNTKSSLLVDRVGMIMFALYQVTVTIVLVNILIAMMSHSFEDVQVSLSFFHYETDRPSIASFIQFNFASEELRKV